MATQRLQTARLVARAMPQKLLAGRRRETPRRIAEPPRLGYSTTTMVGVCVASPAFIRFFLTRKLPRGRPSSPHFLIFQRSSARGECAAAAPRPGAMALHPGHFAVYWPRRPRNAAVSIRRLFGGSRFPGGDFRAFPLPNALAMSAGRRANGRFRSPPRLSAGPKVLPDVPRSDWPPAVPLPREVTAKASRFKIVV